MISKESYPYFRRSIEVLNFIYRKNEKLLIYLPVPSPPAKPDFIKDVSEDTRTQKNDLSDLPKQTGKVLSIVIVIALVVLFIPHEIIFYVFFLGTYLAVTIWIINILDFEQRRYDRKHREEKEREIKAYKAKLAIYENNLTQIKKENELLSNPDTRFAYTSKKKNIFFTSAISPIKVDRYYTKKGISEDSFYNHLYKAFGNKILKNHTIPFEVNRSGYMPDFVFFDKKSNLCIDIEIDEPYTNIDGVFCPIHYCYENGDIDADRNKFFVQNGWIVIRFAEEQIIKFPDQCINFLKKVISSLDVGIETNPNWKINLGKIPRFTEESAKDMIDRLHRDSYLPQKVKLYKQRDIKAFFQEKPKMKNQFKSSTDYLNGEDDLPF